MFSSLNTYMSFDQYSSEETARKKIILESVKGKEILLINLFIEEGPAKLREKLFLHQDYDWQVLFDYLVFQHHLLKICVLKFTDFFRRLVLDQGPQAFRKVFGIEHSMYDDVYEEIFDLIVIATGTLFDYVTAHRQELLQIIKAENGSELRKNVGLTKKKYDLVWQKVLELLYVNFGEELIHERMVEQGMQSFSFLMNTVRSHSQLKNSFN